MIRNSVLRVSSVLRLTKFRRITPSTPAGHSFRLFSATAPDDDDKKKKQHQQSPSILPGLSLAAATATGGFTIAAASSAALAVPVSGIPVSILLGMTLKNTIGYNDATFKPGITMATKTVLQTGIVAVAAKLSFLQLVTTGSSSIPVVLAAVGAGLVVIPVAGRVAGLPKEMTLLLTAGTSICGVTAITALAPAINANGRDIAVAVANTVAFGTMGMLVYPYLFHTLCASPEQVGMCLGVGIHDTSQVLGAALSYKEIFDDQVAFQTAAVTKLMRNLGLAVAIPMLTYSYQKELAAAATRQESGEDNVSASKSDTVSGLMAFTKYVPPFLVAFIGMSAFRTMGDVALDQAHMFHQTMDFIGNDVSKYALGTAMAGVGLSTSASSLKGVGWKPFAVGGTGALVVGGTGFAVASIIV